MSEIIDVVAGMQLRDWLRKYRRGKAEQDCHKENSPDRLHRGDCTAGRVARAPSPANGQLSLVDRRTKASHKLHNSSFGKMPVVAVGFADVRAMASVFRFKKRNVWVRRNLGPSLRKDTNEWIIFCVKNKCRDSDLVDHIRRRCASVVVGSSIKAAVVSGHPVVKIAQALVPTQPRQVVYAGKARRLGAHTGAQFPQEILLVNAVCWKVERV